VSDGFGDDFSSRGTQSNFYRTSKAKRVNLKSLFFWGLEPVTSGFRVSCPNHSIMLLELYSLCVFFQAIEHTFHRRSMLIAESVNHMIQHLTFMALACIDTAKVLLVRTRTIYTRYKVGTVLIHPSSLCRGTHKASVWT